MKIKRKNSLKYMVKFKKKKIGNGHYTFTDLMVDCRYFVSRDNISGFFQIQNEWPLDIDINNVPFPTDPAH